MLSQPPGGISFPSRWSRHHYHSEEVRYLLQVLFNQSEMTGQRCQESRFLTCQSKHPNIQSFSRQKFACPCTPLMCQSCCSEMGKIKSRVRTCYWPLGQVHRHVSWLAWPHTAWKSSNAHSWGLCCHPGLNKSCKHCVGQDSHCCSLLLELHRDDSLVKSSVNGKWEISQDVAGWAVISDTFCCRTVWMGRRQ